MIEVRECSKAFGQTKAVNQATLDIGDREVFGLVGSNGAGEKHSASDDGRDYPTGSGRNSYRRSACVRE